MHYFADNLVDHRSVALLRHKFRTGFKQRKGRYGPYWIRRQPSLKLVVVKCDLHGYTPICHMRGSAPLFGSCVATMDEAFNYLFVTASANIPDFLEQLQREAA